MVPYYPKFATACTDGFDPVSFSINEPSLRVVISPEAIRAMMCCPIFDGTEVFSENTMEEFWNTRRDALSFCQSVLNRILSFRLPRLPLSFNDLKHYELKDISSNLAWLCSQDWEIMTAMMRFLFKCRK